MNRPSFSDVVGECEDAYPSLSGFHDYEPNLEFDDSDLLQQRHDEEENGDDDDDDENQDDDEDLSGGPPENRGAETPLQAPNKADFLQSPMTDGTIEEDFEAALASKGSRHHFDDDDDEEGLGGVRPKSAVAEGTAANLGQSTDFSDIAGRGIVEVVGDDAAGRKIIVISACRLPSNKSSFDHGRFLLYLTRTLDAYVEFDYSLVYFHHGLSSANKPPLRWLWEVYKALDRPYKKNLKSLFLVHPTNFIRVVYSFFKPIISAKFGRKVQYVNYLHELQPFMDLSQLPIPKLVLEYDRKILNGKRGIPGGVFSASRSGGASPSSATAASLPLPTQQFGASLEWILRHNDDSGSGIPPIVEECVRFLSTPECLETEGIFRRCANVKLVKELRDRVNDGQEVRFGNSSEDRGGGGGGGGEDCHVAAVMLKMFFRELQEPLLTFDLFTTVLRFEGIPPVARTEYIREAVNNRIPAPNRRLLKYLVEFLSMVSDSSCLNKMTWANLAVVFGPNLIRSRDQSVSLASIGTINLFAEHMFVNYRQIFDSTY